MGWIGVDFDGTLAVCVEMPVWDGSIGPPVPLMVKRVKRWLAEGKDVRILTARLAPYDFSDGPAGARASDVQRRLVEAWCLEHIGRVLPVTCSKDYGMIRLYDDRAVQVEYNTGRLIGAEDD